MPLADLPLAELEEFEGRNPRPADFDRFWSAALEELAATPDTRVLAPATFESRVARAFDLTFGGVRGARLHAKLLVPRSASGDAPAVLMFHGYTGQSADWTTMLSLASEGFVVAALDVRGQGGQSTDPGGHLGSTSFGHITRGAADAPENLLYRHIYLDCAQLARIVSSLPEVDERRVCAYGGSQGGGLALACAALEPSIARVAALYPFLCDWLRVWELEVETYAYQGLRQHLRAFDPTHARKDEFFTTMGYIDVQHLAPRIEGDVLMGIGLADDVCPPSTQFAAYNRITARKQRVVYPDFGHEVIPGWSDIVFGFLRDVERR
jgi:cephalosporin-C deacetylase